jgi:hypothetical protein
MGKRQLLFVTYRDENLEEGVSYAIELAKAMYEDITLLLVRKKSNLMDKLGNLMTAVSFAEADDHETAREIMTGESGDAEDRYEKMLASLVAVTGSDNVSARDLNRLVRTASRPIVTMTRQACGVAC